MPDFPRGDLIAITVRLSCTRTPGCGPDTPCAKCRESLWEAGVITLAGDLSLWAR